MPLTPEAVMKRYQDLTSQRSNWESDWRDIALYILPRKWGAIGQTPTPGQKITTRLFDSTAIDANHILAAALHGTLTSPASRWFRLKMREENLNRVSSIAEWLEDSSNRTYAAIQQSNWDAEILEVYLDLGAFGTAAMFVQERDDVVLPGFRGMRFEAIPIGTYVIAEDAMGRVDTLCRMYQMSAEAAVRRFTQPGDDVGEKLTDKARDKPSELVDILHCVYPRMGGYEGAIAKRKPYASCYLDVANKHIIRESGYEKFPFVVPRWSKAAGEQYGRGPGHVALPDIKTLNKMTELELRAVAKAIDPPMLVRDHGIIGAVRLTPGATTVTRDDPKMALIPLESGSKFQVGQIKSEQLKAGIRTMFFNSQLQLPSNQPMTATEIERRYELMHRYLGPMVGRFRFECSTPSVEMTVTTLWRRGALAPPPPELIQAMQLGQGDIDILAEGPLARAQTGSDVLAIERWMQLVGSMAQLKTAAPDPVWDTVDTDEASRVIASATGVPASVVHSTDEVNQARTERQQQQAKQEQMNQMIELGKGARNVAPLLKAVAPQGVAGSPGQPAAAPADQNGQPTAAAA